MYEQPYNHTRVSRVSHLPSTSTQTHLRSNDQKTHEAPIDKNHLRFEAGFFCHLTSSFIWLRNDDAAIQEPSKFLLRTPVTDPGESHEVRTLKSTVT